VIELIQITGTKVSVSVRSIVSVSVEAFGTRIATNGDRVYFVKESYEEVIQMIRGNELETK